jgi:hypothetical protein
MMGSTISSTASESTVPLRNDSDDELPVRSPNAEVSFRRRFGKKRWQSLLAMGSDVPESGWRPSVEELDTDADSIVSARRATESRKLSLMTNPFPSKSRAARHTRTRQWHDRRSKLLFCSSAF